MNQQKLSDLSRKVLDLESAEYLAKQKDDLIQKLEDTKKEVRDIYYKKKTRQVITIFSSNTRDRKFIVNLVKRAQREAPPRVKRAAADSESIEQCAQQQN